jgi:hypothetical protein
MTKKLQRMTLNSTNPKPTLQYTSNRSKNVPQKSKKKGLATYGMEMDSYKSQILDGVS